MSPNISPKSVVEEAALSTCRGAAAASGTLRLCRTPSIGTAAWNPVTLAFFDVRSTSSAVHNMPLRSDAMLTPEVGGPVAELARVHVQVRQNAKRQKGHTKKWHQKLIGYPCESPYPPQFLQDTDGSLHVELVHLAQTLSPHTNQCLTVVMDCVGKTFSYR